MRYKFRLWPVLTLALIFLAFIEAYTLLRNEIFRGGLNAQSLHIWWVVLPCWYFMLFVLWATLFVVGFRKHLSLESKVVLTGIIFAGCAIFAISSITSDPVILPALSTVGLSQMHNVLFGMGCLWAFFSLYTLFMGVDHKFASTR